MLHVCVSTEETVRAQFRARAHAEPALSVMQAHTFNLHEFIQKIEGANLFGDTTALLCDELVAGGVFNDLDAYLVRMEASPQTIYLLERGAVAAVKKALKKHSTSFTEDEVRKKEARGGGVFQFTHAFEAKKRAEGWMLYQEALINGDAAEALHGMLFWKVKNMMKGSRSRTPTEVRALLGDLAALPVTARRRGVELELALEQFILER